MSLNNSGNHQQQLPPLEQLQISPPQRKLSYSEALRFGGLKGKVAFHRHDVLSQITSTRDECCEILEEGKQILKMRKINHHFHEIIFKRFGIYDSMVKTMAATNEGDVQDPNGTTKAFLVSKYNDALEIWRIQQQFRHFEMILKRLAEMAMEVEKKDILTTKEHSEYCSELQLINGKLTVYVEIPEYLENPQREEMLVGFMADEVNDGEIIEEN